MSNYSGFVVKVEERSRHGAECAKYTLKSKGRAAEVMQSQGKVNQTDQ